MYNFLSFFWCHSWCHSWCHTSSPVLPQPAVLEPKITQLLESISDLATRAVEESRPIEDINVEV